MSADGRVGSGGTRRRYCGSCSCAAGCCANRPTASLDFVHRTFQDYLGARYAVAEGHLDVLVSHADDTQWEDVIRMAVAHARPRERAAVLRQLLARDTTRLTLLALACLETRRPWTRRYGRRSRRGPLP
ncbi:hypothetical protein LT493_36890 [Streptomyces tricolor]|nr:hypothetical protein [Streptomyces tricolor]